MILAKHTKANPYILALQSKKIIDLPIILVQHKMCDLISTTYFEAGQALPGGDQAGQAKHLQTIARALYDEVTTYFPFLGEDELSIAFRSGVREEYGQYFGINIISFHKWIKGYISDTKRQEAKQALHAANEVQVVRKPIMSATQAEHEWKRAIESSFSKYKQTGNFNIPFPSYVQREFVKMGLMEDGVEKFMEEAAVQVRKLKKAIMLSPRNLAERQAASGYLSREREERMSDEDSVEVRAEAHRQALKAFFDSIEKLEL